MLTRLAAATLLCLASVAGPAVAQQPSTWNVLKIPGGVQPNHILQRGKVLAYQDGGTLHAWSGLTRSFQSTTVSANASLSVANDLLLIVESRKVTAFASYTGRFASITVGANATIVNPAAQKNDSIVLVHDGNTIWAISGFVGQWIKLTVGAGARAAVQRNVAVVADGKNVHGMSAFRSRWKTAVLPAAPVTIAADGTVGVATTAGRLHGFSAMRETWTSAAAPTGATTTFRIEDDVAVWWDDLSYTAFSGLRGTFSQVVVGIKLWVLVSEQLVVGQWGQQHWIYSAVLGTWTNFSLPSHPALRVGPNVVLMTEGVLGKAWGFSGITGTWASFPIHGGYRITTANVAVVQDVLGTAGGLYSAITGRWSAIPTNAIRGSSPAVTTTGALIRTQTGYTAWSARTDTFHPVKAVATSLESSNTSSAIMAVSDTKTLHVFDTRRNVWLTEKLQSGLGLAVHLWRTSFIALDGNRAIGYGAFHGRIESLPLPATAVEFRSHSESSRVVTRNTIAAFSASPLLSTPWQAPEFRRTFVRGADLDVHLSARSATGRAYLAIGVSPPFRLPGLGDVMLDSALLVPGSIPFDARNGTARTSIPVPDVPILRGLEVFMQALVIPTAGQPYVTNLASVRLN